MRVLTCAFKPHLCAEKNLTVLPSAVVMMDPSRDTSMLLQGPSVGRVLTCCEERRSHTLTDEGRGKWGGEMGGRGGRGDGKGKG